MSIVENVNFCYSCDQAFETKKQFIKHNLSEEHLNRARKEYEDEVEDPQSGFTDEIFEKVCHLDADDYVLKPKDLRSSYTDLQSSFANNTKDIIKTKPTTKPKTKKEEDIYSKIKFECKECNQEFRNKIALTTHSYSHNRKYLGNTAYFDINSSQNMKEFYITDKAVITLKM